MVKKLLFFILLVSMVMSGSAQWINKSFVFDATTREYRIYVPPAYNPAVPASLVITLHGLGDNMMGFSTLGFNYIADTANIIIICPQAIEDPLAGTAWNSGAGYAGVYYPNASVNDVGFINALVDAAKADYSIDPSRVYLCGFSMGGFMTERMALQSNQNFAAFASMSGTIGSAISVYNPGRSVPIAHFHGTSDSTVYYTGNEFGIDADSLVKFWTLNNNSTNAPDSVRLPDAAADNITIDKFTYNGLNPDQEVLFYRMNGAGHDILYQPANDMTELMEVWMFFRRHQNTTLGMQKRSIDQNIIIYPNPATDFIDVIIPSSVEKAKIELFTNLGELIYSAIIKDSSHYINLKNIKKCNGVYLIRVSGVSFNHTEKIIIEN